MRPDFRGRRCVPQAGRDRRGTRPRRKARQRPRTGTGRLFERAIVLSDPKAPASAPALRYAPKRDGPGASIDWFARAGTGNFSENPRRSIGRILGLFPTLRKSFRFVAIHVFLGKARHR